MTQNSITKPKNVDYFHVPRPLWRKVKKLLPKLPKQRSVVGDVAPLLKDLFACPGHLVKVPTLDDLKELIDRGLGRFGPRPCASRHTAHA